MMYDLFLSWYTVKVCKQVITTVVNFIIKETIVNNSHIIKIMGTLDTRHFFYISLAQGLVFQGIPKGQESKSLFFEGRRRF